MLGQSEYNVLVDTNGPVIIDLPQAVNASSNNNAFRMLERDINNLRETFGRVAPELLDTHYAHEIWALYESGKLTEDTPLTGRHAESTRTADVGSVLQEIDSVRLEHEARERYKELLKE